MARTTSQLQPLKIKIIPQDPTGDHQSRVAKLHQILGPFFVHIQQDLSHRAAARFPFVDGGYTLVFPRWAYVTAAFFFIEGSGFCLEIPEPESEGVSAADITVPCHVLSPTAPLAA